MTTEELIEKTAKEMLGELNVMLDHNKVQVGTAAGGTEMIAVQLADDTTDYIDGKLCEYTKKLVLTMYGLENL